MNEYGQIERNHEEYGVGTGEGLKVFEKTWGHRVLLGLSACMFVAGAVVAIYCGVRLSSVSALVGENAGYAMAYALYVVGLLLGAGMIPPAILGVFTATHPKTAAAAIAAAVIALLLDAAFVVYAVVIGGQAFSIAMYAVLLAVIPVIYLACAAKIKAS